MSAPVHEATEPPTAHGTTEPTSAHDATEPTSVREAAEPTSVHDPTEPTSAHEATAPTSAHEVTEAAAAEGAAERASPGTTTNRARTSDNAAERAFHLTDEPVDLSAYRFEDWITFVIFWALALVVFYQVFTRYVLGNAAGWTEEIARYLLVAVVFIGASISVRKNNHIQVDFFYRLMPRALQRGLSITVDVLRVAFLGYAAWLSYQLTQRIGGQRMAIVDLPMGYVFSAMTFGFALMCLRALQVARRHHRLGYSVLERPEIALADAAGGQGYEEVR